MTSAPDTDRAHRALRPLRPGYVLYQIAAHLLLPVLLAVLAWRSRREALYRAHVSERFGAVPRLEPGAIVVFAASLGETRAAQPLVARLVAQDRRVMLVHSSAAGRSAGAELFAKAIAARQVVQSYVPLDLWWCVRRALDRIAPAAVLVMEAEIWPALVAETVRRGCPILQINGSLNARTVERTRTNAVERFRLAHLNAYDHITTKSPDFAARYHTAGLPESRVSDVGELKFDLAPDPVLIAQGEELRHGAFDGRPILVFASSVAAEEDALFGMLGILFRRIPGVMVVWVPRSPQRFDAVARQLERRGWEFRRRSETQGADMTPTAARTAGSGGTGKIGAAPFVFLGDSLGEMPFYLALGDLIFVGASLSDDGGHNIVEPLAQGKPVVMGPSIYGIEFPARDAADAGAFESLPTAEALTERAAVLLSDPDQLGRMADRAAKFGRSHQGAAQRTIEIVLRYVP